MKPSRGIDREDIVAYLGLPPNKDGLAVLRVAQRNSQVLRPENPLITTYALLTGLTAVSPDIRSLLGVQGERLLRESTVRVVRDKQESAGEDPFSYRAWAAMYSQTRRARSEGAAAFGVRDILFGLFYTDESIAHELLLNERMENNRMSIAIYLRSFVMNGVAGSR